MFDGTDSRVMCPPACCQSCTVNHDAFLVELLNITANSDTAYDKHALTRLMKKFEQVFFKLMLFKLHNLKMLLICYIQRSSSSTAALNH